MLAALSKTKGQTEPNTNKHRYSLLRTGAAVQTNPEIGMHLAVRGEKKDRKKATQCNNNHSMRRKYVSQNIDLINRSTGPHPLVLKWYVGNGFCNIS